MAHPSVSRSHALLVVDRSFGAFLVDLGASNGSFVDGRVSESKPSLCISLCSVCRSTNEPGWCVYSWYIYVQFCVSEAFCWPCEWHRLWCW